MPKRFGEKYGSESAPVGSQSAGLANSRQIQFSEHTDMLLPAQFKETGIFVYMYPDFYNQKDVLTLKRSIR